MGIDQVKNQLLADDKVKWVYTLDLETTCGVDLRDRKDVPEEEGRRIFEEENAERETTEIGAVLCPKDQSLVYSRFDSLVCPLNPRVTPFSLELCPHITLEEMKKAMPFPMVLNRMVQRILAVLEPEGETLENVAFLQWGGFDWKQIIRECNRHNLAPPAFAGKVDVKKWFKKAHGPLDPGTKAMSGVDAALRTLRQRFQGVPHKAYSDAYNTWRIYRALRIQGKL